MDSGEQTALEGADDGQASLTQAAERHDVVRPAGICTYVGGRGPIRSDCSAGEGCEFTEVKVRRNLGPRMSDTWWGA